MTLKEAMGYRGENADTLAEKIGIRAGEVRRWMGENGMLRISGARMQQLAAALDGGVLVTADGRVLYTPGLADCFNETEGSGYDYQLLAA